MSLRISVVALSTVLLFGCASQSEDQVASNEDGMFCEMTKPTGSNIPKRVCLTAEQKAQQEKAGQDYVNQQRNRATTSSMN
ncbi:hypothetical protein V1358_06615 [Pseudoalteromonas sp. YIC-656]|uniref:hypothetical protein n=1 Tax=Pseudoalteromonas pernae TaxID=3118054 RepID=UPI0032420063